MTWAATVGVDAAGNNVGDSVGNDVVMTMAGLMVDNGGVDGR